MCDVAREADLQTGVIGYHYPIKEELFDTVVHRRAAVMAESRQRMLAQMRASHGFTFLVAGLSALPTAPIAAQNQSVSSPAGAPFV